MAKILFNKLLAYAEKTHRAQYPQYFRKDQGLQPTPLLTTGARASKVVSTAAFPSGYSAGAA